MKGYFVSLREWLFHEWLFAMRMKSNFVKFSEAYSPFSKLKLAYTSFAISCASI